MPTLTVVTFNVAGHLSGRAMPRQRLLQQINALRALTPTVVYLQEMWNLEAIEQYTEIFKDTHVVYSSGGHDFGNKLGRFIRYHIVFFVMTSPVVVLVSFFIKFCWIALLLSVFPSLAYYFFGSRNIFDTLIYGDQMGLTTLVPKEMQVNSVNKCAFIAQPRELSLAGLWEWGHGPRGFLEVIGKWKGMELQLLNVHMNVGVINKGRIKQAEELASHCRRASGLVVIAGDFNADAQQPEMCWLASQQFRDVFVEHYNCAHCNNSKACAKCYHGGCTWHSQNPLTRGCLREPNQRMDHILVRGTDISVKHAGLALYDPPCSDHFALTTELSFS